MTATSNALPSLPADLATAQAMIVAERAARQASEAQLATALETLSFAQGELAHVRAEASDTQVLIERLQLEIKKLKRAMYGHKSERTALLIDQLEFQLEDMEASATEDELAAIAVRQRSHDIAVRPFERKRPARQSFPEHLQRERRVIAAPKSCPCCGSERLSRLGEDITETLEVVPRQWKVIQTVREKVSCRDCERIHQEPAPFHVTPRGFLGANLLAMVLFEKFGQHQPLNRQSERYGREGIDLPLSTLADNVGACAFALKPLHALIERHVLAAERLHGDDTTIPILAKEKTKTGRLWVYVRDDRPFGGKDPPAVVFYASPDRKADHPKRHLAGFGGILQADAYGGYDPLYDPGRLPEPITQGLCWAHARRKFFELCDVTRTGKSLKDKAISPIALEAVRRIDNLFEIEREINGLPALERLAIREVQSEPVAAALIDWLRERRAKLSRHADVAGAIDYVLKRVNGFTNFLKDGRICLSNNAAERALRGVALGRKAWLFAGSDRGAERAAQIYTLIQTARLNGVDPQAWLADVLARINDIPQTRLHELLPWEWQRTSQALKRSAA
jgi:transposase